MAISICTYPHLTFNLPIMPSPHLPKHLLDDSWNPHFPKTLTNTKLELAGCRSVYVAAFYRPHESDSHSLDGLQKSLERVCNKTASHVWMGGDFNFPGYNWAHNHIKANCNQPELTRKFLDIISDNSLF